MTTASFLRRHRVAITMVVSALIGVGAAVSSLYRLSLSPPALQAKTVTIGVAATHVMVDARQGLVPDRTATGLVFNGYEKQATLFANLLASAPLRDLIAQRMKLSPDVLAARARVTGVGNGAFTDTLAEQRASQLVVANRPYKLEMQPDPTLPVLAIYAQAPTASAAVRLANVSVAALHDYVAANPALTDLGAEPKFEIKQLGPARGAVVNGQETIEMLVLTFLVAFGVACALLFGIPKVRRGFVARAAEPGSVAGTQRDVRAPQAPAEAGGNWPHTTRVMPWLIAGFLVIIWLVPFNGIQLSASLPFDLKLDRLVLPILLVIWVLSIAAGGPAAPRPRLTRIHAGFLAFAAVVGLGIVLNATSLNQALEFNLATKKLTLLLSYGLIFAIIASSVRRGEVQAFLKFSLVLAVICAIGTIWEYRFHYNIFYDLSSKVLGHIFQVIPYNPNQIDEIGRRMVRGPADHPLELVGMLVMMFPLALVGILRSDRRRDRTLYGIAACLLIAATVATDRKSALLAPLAVVLTVGYFYRRKLLRLAPLALVLVLAVHALSPGALGTVVDQLNPSRLGVSTVSDRASDYDAVRPDIWSHLAFGRGYGTYDHLNYRTLDSDMLNRLIDTGVLGVCAFIFMLGCIISVARRVIRTRDPARAPAALAVAAAATAYFVLTFLFDVSSFPHVPYALFSVAGLLAASEAEEPRTGTLRRLTLVRAPRPALVTGNGTGGVPVPEREFVH
jgi:hypothetical protein